MKHIEWFLEDRTINLKRGAVKTHSYLKLSLTLVPSNNSSSN